MRSRVENDLASSGKIESTRWKVPSTCAPPLGASALLSLAGYFGTLRMAVAAAPLFIKAGLKGIDLNKPGTKRDARGELVRPIEGPVVPEAMGAIACAVYLVTMFMFIPFPFLHDFDSWGAPVGGSWRGGSGSSAAAAQVASAQGTPFHLPLAHISKFLCALLAICCICFLGFADDVLDLRWRDRLSLPLAASLPLLMVYAVDGGGTRIIIPRVFASLLGPSMELGIT